MHTYIHKYAGIRTHTHTHTHTYTHTHTHTHTTHIHTQSHTPHTHTYTHIHRHTYTHTPHTHRTHIHTHTYTTHTHTFESAIDKQNCKYTHEQFPTLLYNLTCSKDKKKYGEEVVFLKRISLCSSVLASRIDWIILSMPKS